MENKTNKDTTTTQAVMQTSDYSIFKKLKGNRNDDKSHVTRLKNNMLEVGNLTAEFPIVVNEYMEVIDGQHRLAALKELKWPVGYRIHPGLTLDTVRGINQAQRNWSWLDYATSFATNGTAVQRINYQGVLDLHREFGYSKSVLMIFCGMSTHIRGTDVQSVGFNQGDLILPHYERSYRLLTKYRDLTSLIGRQDTMVASALYKIMQNPIYDHERMMHKATINDIEIKRQTTVEDYARILENMYNNKMTADNKVRLY